MQTMPTDTQRKNGKGKCLDGQHKRIKKKLAWKSLGMNESVC